MEFSFLFILCVVLCVSNVEPYQCRKEETIEKLNYPEERELKVIKIFCTGVTQQTVFNHSYINEQYPQHLYISTRYESNSIPILHSNSSISKFAGIRKLSLRRINLEVICRGALDSFETLEELDLSRNKIGKIANGTFNHLKNLELLDLSHNNIEVIEEGSFSNLHRLHILNLGYNNLTKIHSATFNNLKILQRLDVSKNLIKTIEEDTFSGLVNLEYLNINYNEISYIHENSFRSLTALTKLDLSANKISDFPNNLFINLSNLENLRIVGNKLTAVNFANFPKVKQLFLSHNNIISYRNCKKLNTETLAMGINQITELELPENVVNLHLSNNKIRNIINKFSDESKPIIETLQLTENEISNIDSNSFKKLVKLNKLILNFNKITIIRENTFKDCILLSKLDMAYNKIESIEPNAFNGIHPSAKIDISGNNLKVLRSDIFSDQIVKITLCLDEEVDRTDLQSFLNSSKVEVHISPL